MSRSFSPKDLVQLPTLSAEDAYALLRPLVEWESRVASGGFVAPAPEAPAQPTPPSDPAAEV